MQRNKLIGLAVIALALFMLAWTCTVGFSDKLIDKNGDGKVDWHDSDVNNDGKVDMLDMYAIQHKSGLKLYDAGYDTRYDLDGDYIISEQDVKIVQSYFGSLSILDLINPTTPVGQLGLLSFALLALGFILYFKVKPA